MQRKDIAIIVGVAIVVAIFSYVISNVIFGKSTDVNKLLTAPEVTAVTSEFTQPDPRYFNKDALNPTKTITIGESNN